MLLGKSSGFIRASGSYSIDDYFCVAPCRDDERYRSNGSCTQDSKLYWFAAGRSKSGGRVENLCRMIHFLLLMTPARRTFRLRWKKPMKDMILDLGTGLRGNDGSAESEDQFVGISTVSPMSQ